MIGLIGDTHVGRTLFGYDLTPHIRRTMYGFYEFCLLNRCKTAVHLGDVFDRPRPLLEHEKLVAQWVNLFEKSGINLLIMCGNHDVVAKPGLVSALDLLKASGGYRHLQIIDRPRWIDGIFLLPFPSPSLYGTRQEWLDEAQEVWYEQNEGLAVFSHLNVQGAVLGDQEWVYRGGDYMLPDFVLNSGLMIVNGHIHNQQIIGEDLLLLGSAQHLRFGEQTDSCSFGLMDRGGDIELHDYDALNLICYQIRAQDSDEPLTTESVKRHIDSLPETEQINGETIVKVLPQTDNQTTCDWAEIEQHLYGLGAAFVKVSNPILIGSVPRNRKTRVTGEPQEIAKSFIVERIKDKREQKAVYRKFKSLQASI